METTTWLPIATLVLGIVLGHLLDWHKERRTESREQEARRRTFQRQAILDTQDAVYEAFRLSAELHWEAQRHLRKFGKWPSEDEIGLEREIANPGLNSHARLAKLRGQIEDQEFQSIISEILRCVSKAIGEQDEASAEAAMHDFSRTIGRLNTHARQLLADLY